MPIYKIRRSARNRSLTVPPEIARQIPDDATFVCEMQPTGIFYRAVNVIGAPVGGWGGPVFIDPMVIQLDPMTTVRTTTDAWKPKSATDANKEFWEIAPAPGEDMKP